jgi:hypothetical protein
MAAKEQVGLLVEIEEGNQAIVLFASHEAADRWRDAFEDRIQTYGILPVRNRNDVVFGGD